jgi:hypothetical protein
MTTRTASIWANSDISLRESAVFGTPSRPIPPKRPPAPEGGERCGEVDRASPNTV